MIVTRYNILFKFLIITALIACKLGGFAQNDMMLHNFRILPQSTVVNPSYIPNASGHVALPVSSLYFDIKHSGFSYNDVFDVRADDSLEISEDGIIKALDKHNYFNVSTHVQPVSFGFKVKRNNYFNFSITEKIDISASYPKDFMLMVIKGTDEFRKRGEPAEFDAFDFNMSVYNEIAFGYAREINYQWSAGIKAKLLFGQANIWTEKSDIKYYVSGADTSNYAYNAESDLIINASFPFEVHKDSITDAIDEYFDYLDDNPDDLTSTENVGIAFDLGVTYRPTENSTVSLSVLDLGYIDWKRESKSFYNDGDFYFNGYPIRELINDSTELADGLENLLDSIIDEFDIKEKSVGSYRASLNTKIYFGGTYDLTKNDRFGALFRGEFFYGNFLPSFSLSYNRMFGKAFALATNYSLYKESYFNIGLGGMFTTGPFQMYLMSDNVYGAFDYKNAKNINVRFGINFLINKWAGAKDDDDRMRHMPSFYKSNRMLNRFY